MAERVLRDQCDHGRYEKHEIKTGRLYGTDITEPCPGGREVSMIRLADYIESLPTPEAVVEFGLNGDGWFLADTDKEV